MAGPAAAERGSLEETPFAGLLVQLGRSRVTGRAMITDENGGVSAVYLRHGIPVHVDRPDDQDRLDRVLASTGAVEKDTLARAESLRRSSGRRLGEVLSEMGVIDGGMLLEALRFQLRRKLSRLFLTQRGHFEILAEDHEYGVGVGTATVKVDGSSIVYPGIRAAYDEARLVRELARLAGRMARLAPVSSAILRELGFEAPDEPMLRQLWETGIRVEGVESLTSLPTDRKAALLALLHLGLLEVSALPPAPPSRPAPAKPPSATGSYPRIPPSQVPSAAGSSPRLPAKPAAPPAGGSASGGHSIPPESGSHASAPRSVPPESSSGLGIPRASRPGESSSRLASPRPVAAGDSSIRLRAPVSAAPDGVVRPTGSRPTVSDSHRTSGLRPGLDAASLVKKGEQFLANGDLMRAEEAFTIASQVEPQEPIHGAYIAWVRFWNPAASRDEAAKEAVVHIAQVLKARPKFARGHYFIGQLFKYLGDRRKAEFAFRTALREDPQIKEAESELRLLSSRKTK